MHVVLFFGFWADKWGMKDLAFTEDDALLEIYYTSKATFLPEDYVALSVILSAALDEEAKSQAIKTLMENAMDRYVTAHGTVPFPPVEYPTSTGS